MKKTKLLLAAGLLLGLIGCDKSTSTVDIYAPNNSQTTNIYNGTNNPSPGSNNNGNNNNTNSVLNANVKIGNILVGTGVLYEVGSRTLLDFDWNQLPSDCRNTKVTVLMYDKVKGSQYNYLPYGTSIEMTVNSNHATVTLPTDNLPFNCEATVEWHIVPECTSSTINAATGKFSVIRR